MKTTAKRNIIASIVSLLIIILLFTNSISACTGFIAHHDDVVLVGHNKDWWSPDTWIHVYPSEKDRYARLFFEIPYPHIFNSEYKVLAGGFNEHGLCFESFVTPFKLASFEIFKPPLFKNPVDFILQQYTTVQEVVDYIESHNLFFLNYILCSGQIFVVDKTGDAAIIEGDDIIRMKDHYQICTNFLHSQPSLGGYPCWRYDRALSFMENLSTPTVPLFKSILNATHQDYYTQYSWIYDPQSHQVSVYHYYDYNHPLQINLTQEFSQEAHTYYLPSLFEPKENQAPKTPVTITGPSSARIKEELIFETMTTDLDNDPTELLYQWDFGDGIQTYWLKNRPPFWGKASHIYSKPGTYEISVRARDIYGKESLWSSPFQITITRGKAFFLPNFI